MDFPLDRHCNVIYRVDAVCSIIISVQKSVYYVYLSAYSVSVLQEREHMHTIVLGNTVEIMHVVKLVTANFSQCILASCCNKTISV